MTSPTDAPGRRLKNPLGALSSYTYQLSLYMITPDAYDAFNATGRRSINALAEASGEENTGGAYLIAQSGGVNNDESQRAPGFDLDYYIDNFKLKQAINGAATQSSTNMYSVSFDIIEPYGFSFNTKLKRASDQLQAYYNETGYSGDGEIENPSRQFFIIGVRFLGYDASGDLIRGDLDFEGDVLDPNANGNSIFQTYYDISITGIKFSIEGGATRYALSGVALSPGKAFGIKRGRIDSTKTVSGQTFDQALQGGKPGDEDIPGVGLFTQLNAIEQQKVDQDEAEFPNVYTVEYIGDGVDAIKDARLILPTDTDKSKWCGPDGGALDIDQATDAEAATAVPNDAHRKIIFNGDTTFIEIFDEILKGSGYMYDALKAIYKSQAAPDLTTGEQPQEDPGSNTKVAWYKVTPVIQKAKWDSIVVDWAYETIFRIEKYETPIVTTSVTNPSMDYYGPHKRYEYWWTGENREILEYSQKLDNLFYNEVLGNANLNNEDNDQKGRGSGGAAQTPVATNKSTSMPALNAVGGGRSSQNEYVTSLYSPDSYATAKIKILGDPDFLVQEHRGGATDSVYQRFYGDDGFRVTANGGQVFIEIDFKEAIDYNGETGVMDLNESILFFRYPSSLENTIKGVSYKIITIDSTFSEGKFTQELSCAINTFADPEPESTSGDEAGTEEEGESENEEGNGET
tara:strand:+ start:6409 stop:8466 length:2058 start_codon:yes stop_codon:yes gene_type:complete